jgi:hypothetical protein
MMVRARPMMKPFRTGSEMKLATNPRRRSPATSATSPVTRASTMVKVRNSASSVARSATAAADSAAVAAIGPVTRWRELPNAA